MLSLQSAASYGSYGTFLSNWCRSINGFMRALVGGRRVGHMGLRRRPIISVFVLGTTVPLKHFSRQNTILDKFLRTVQKPDARTPSFKPFLHSWFRCAFVSCCGRLSISTEYVLMNVCLSWCQPSSPYC